MDNLDKLISFLEKLEKAKIFFKLDKIRDSILVEIAVPMQRWEVEFMQNGEVCVEIFKSDGDIYDGGKLDILFQDYSD